MAKSNSSKRWLKEHFDDEFVKQSRHDGFRSRAVYKLKELNDKDNLFSKGGVVVDLGAAPGAWTQFAMQKVGTTGEVIALDILKMDDIPGVTIIQGDFTENEVLDQLLNVIGERSIDTVISDMAPNLSGMDSIDQARSTYLVELAVDLADQVLKAGGDFVAKIFQGEGFDDIVKDLRLKYSSVKIRKPKASRSRSREVYLVALNKKQK